jgi:hypothetical protein
MMTQLNPPIPVVSELGEGLVLYVRDGGPMGNDVCLVALDDGRFLHFLWSQLRSVGNATFGIGRPKPDAHRYPEMFTGDAPLSDTAAAARKLAGR